MCRKSSLFAVAALFSLVACHLLPADEPPPADKPEPVASQDGQSAESAPAVQWQTDYGTATDLASRQAKMLVIFFFDPTNERCTRLEAEALTDRAVCAKLQDYVCVKLPVDTKIGLEGEEKVLIEHPCFQEMRRQPGIAIVDYASSDPSLQEMVVSAFPLTPRLGYTPQQMLVILNLPPGTLTQRTLIYAVRIHPERPASTTGTADPTLLREAESHAAYQARIRLQGHHQWGSRFPRITALLPRGLVAREVCAESWPGQDLLEAAIECVRCWRCSSGHWNAVRSFHNVFGYDMKLGSNGIWYATGIFGCR